MLRRTPHGVTVMGMSWGCWYRVSVPCMGLVVPGLTPRPNFMGPNPAEGAWVGKPRGLSCHTPHLGFWHPAFLQLLMETPGGGEGEAHSLGSWVKFVWQISAVIPFTVSSHIQRGLWGAPASPAPLVLPRVWLLSWGDIHRVPARGQTFWGGLEGLLPYKERCGSSSCVVGHRECPPLTGGCSCPRDLGDREHPASVGEPAQPEPSMSR